MDFINVLGWQRNHGRFFFPQSSSRHSIFFGAVMICKSFRRRKKNIYIFRLCSCFFSISSSTCLYTYFSFFFLCSNRIDFFCLTWHSVGYLVLLAKVHNYFINKTKTDQLKRFTVGIMNFAMEMSVTKCRHYKNSVRIDMKSAKIILILRQTSHNFTLRDAHYPQKTLSMTRLGWIRLNQRSK